MRTGFRQSMAWLHAWSGLVVGWVLFAVFVTGTASYYKPEIARWMQPELVAREALAPEAVAAAVDTLHAVADGSLGWVSQWQEPSGGCLVLRARPDAESWVLS